MLSDLVKSRVTALLPGWEVVRKEGTVEVKGICFLSNTQTSNKNRHTGDLSTVLFNTLEACVNADILNAWNYMNTLQAEFGANVLYTAA